MSSFLLTLYLAGVFINCCVVICYLIDAYICGKTLTISKLLINMFIILASWIFIVIIMLGPFLYYLFEIISTIKKE